MGHKVSIQPGIFFFAALAMLILPLRWWLGALAAAMVHEFAHVTAVYLLGGEFLGVNISAFGAVIQTMPMQRWRGALASAAGPVGSLLTLLLARFYPEMAVCGLFHGLYNLLPVYPLDGGRIVRCIFSRKICTMLEVTTILAVTLLCVWLYIRSSLGAASYLPLVTLLLMCHPRKLSCKESNLAVQ